MNESKIKAEMLTKFLIKHYKKIGIGVGLLIFFALILKGINSFTEYLASLSFLGNQIITKNGAIALVVAAICTGVIALLIFAIWISYKSKSEEIEGVKIREKDGSYGTATWLKDKEAEEILNIGTGNGIILGETNNKMITLPHDTHGNKNIAVIGASGSMKTRAFMMTNMLQLGAEGKSLIITDPKLELYERLGSYLEYNDYDVKIFNPGDIGHSNKWNPLLEIKNEIDAQIFTDIIINNTSDNNIKKDAFWENGEKNLLKALALYLVEKCEPEEKKLAKLYEFISNNKFYELDQLFSVLNNNSAAKMSYNIYSQASDTVKSGIIMGLGTRLQIFQNKEIQELTNKSDMDLTKPAKSKCAYFCATSDMNTTFDFLAGLFFSFLFIKLVDYADKGPKVCNPEVFFMLDEFSNIGQIPDFKKKISTMRSRGVHCFIIFQNIAQLKNRYPNDAWEEILGNCDIHIFMGGNDATTVGYISKLLGIATVATVSENRSPGLWDGTTERVNYGSSPRNLMNPDELLRLPKGKEVIIVRGQKPYMVNKLDYSRITSRYIKF